MNINTLQISKIGCIPQGVNGTDEYLLVWDNETAHSAEQLKRHLTEVYYRDTNAPGGYFCHSVSVIPHPAHHGYKHIAIVHHRYDI